MSRPLRISSLSDDGAGMTAEFRAARPEPGEFTADNEFHVHAGRAGFDLGDREIGKYVLLDKLGEGGMGVVYLAYDTLLRRECALKWLRSDQRQDRLLKEAQTLAAIQHPNIVPLYEIGEHKGRAYLVMAYIRGQSLLQWQREADRPWPVILAVYLQAGEALVAAHRRGVIHRDFKPENVIVSDEGTTIVLDFGLARVRTPRPEDGSPSALAAAQGQDSATDVTLEVVAGTLAYMAPEQRGGRTVTAAADQYSFCLALSRALQGPKQEGRLRGNADARRRVPLWVRRCLAIGLREDPHERWSSMGSLLQALRNDPALRWRRYGLGLPIIMLVVLVVWIGDAARRELNALSGYHRNRIPVSLADEDIEPAIVAGLLQEVDDPGLVPRWRSEAVKLLNRRMAWSICDAPGSPLLSVTFSPDGKRVLAGTTDGSVWICDVDGIRAPVQLRGHSDAINTIVFSPDGRFLVTTSNDHTSIVRDWRAGGEVAAVLRGYNGDVYSAGFDPGSRMLFTTHERGAVRLWRRGDDDSWKETAVLPGHRSDVFHGEWSSDGRMLVTASGDTTARLWSVEPEPRLLATLAGHSKTVIRAHFDARGAHVVTASWDGSAKIWSVPDGMLLRTLETAEHAVGLSDALFHDDEIVTVGKSADVLVWGRDHAPRRLSGLGGLGAALVGEELLAIANAEEIHLRTLSHPKALPERLKGHASEVRALAFDRARSRMASGSSDGTVRVWELGPAGSPPRSAAHDGTAVLAPLDERTFVSVGADGAIQWWDAASRRLRDERRLPAGIPRLLHSSPNGVLLTLDTRLWLMAATWQRPIELGAGPKVTWAEWFPEHRRVLGFDRDGGVHLWSIDGTRSDYEQLRIKDPHNVSSARLGGEDIIVVGHKSGAVSLLRVRDLGLVERIPPNREQRVQGAGIIHGREGEVYLYVRSGLDIVLWHRTGGVFRKVRRIPGVFPSVAVTPDRRSVILGSAAGNWARLSLDDLKREPVFVPGHNGAIHGIDFSPDGALMATQERDELIVWRMRDGVELVRLGPDDFGTRSGSRVLLLPSTDGDYTLTLANDRGEIMRWWLGASRTAHGLRDLLRQRTHVCLTAAQLRERLGDEPELAKRRARACEERRAEARG